MIYKLKYIIIYKDTKFSHLIWNILGLHTMTSDVDVNHNKMMNPSVFGDPLTFHLVLTSEQNVNWYKRKIKIRREIAFQFKEHVDTF